MSKGFYFMYKFIVYSRKSRQAQDGHTQYTHITSEWHIQNYLKTLDAQGIEYQIIDKYEEDISGGGYYTNRPIFKSIVDRCKEDKSLTLLVAKADRMTRNMRTGAELMEIINFTLANAPDADDTQKHLEFMIAEREYKTISSRFKDMASAKRARCEKSGEKFVWGANSPNYGKNSKGGNPNRNRAAEAKSRTVAQAERIKIIAQSVDKSPTYAMIAEKLNKQNVILPNGKEGTWSPIQVKRICDRHEINIYNC
jgi:DNA invertase Pin-like site-specific DNA recombinase